MSNAQTVKAQIQSLINKANETTGNQDTNLTDGVNALVSGYGQGGSGGSASLNIHYGDNAPSDTSMLWCKCNEPSNVLINNDLEVGTENLISGVSTLPYACSDMGVGVVGKKAYIFGGEIASGKTNKISVFDAETKVVTELTTTLPSNTYSLGVGVVGKNIYLFGGYTTSYRSEIYKFDTEKEELTKLNTTLPNDCSRMATAVVGTKIYLFGGERSTGNLSTIFVFDSETETITTSSTTLPSSRRSMSAGAIGKNIYLFGGLGATTIYKFDTETNTIKTLSQALPVANGRMGSGVIGTKVYLFGGGDALTPIYAFDSATETLTTLSTKLNPGGYSISSGVIGDNVYLFGGIRGGYSNRIDNFVVKYSLEQGKLQIVSDNQNNLFNLLNGDVVMEIGVNSVYLGNSDGNGEQVEAYLYQNNIWTQI